jgi:tetratricopeptide (TPR) repeat protein
LELLGRGSSLEAVGRFETAVTEDPGFALAYSRLGEANFLIGHGEDAADHSRHAVELSEDLPPQERYMILARDAQIRNDLDAGVEAYEVLLQYRPGDPDLHYELGLLYENAGLLDQAQSQYAEVLEEDPDNLRALLGTGSALARKGDGQAALAPLDRALHLAREAGNREAEANALQAIGLAHTKLNQPAEGLGHYEQSLSIKRELGDERGMASSLTHIAFVHQLTGEWDQARAAYQKTIDLQRSIRDARGEGESLMSLAEMERVLGNYDEALMLARQALRIQVEMSDELNQSSSLNNIGAIYYMQGNYDDALVYYQRSLEIRQRLDLPAYLATTLHNLGETYAIMGRFEEAQDHFLRALELYRELGDERGLADESGYLSRVFALQGRYGAALDSIEQSIEAFQRIGDESLWFVEAMAWHGQVLNLLGRGEEASPLLERALTLAEERADPWVLTQALNFEGDRYYFQGDLTAAKDHYARALEVAQKSGDPMWRLTSRVDLAKIQTETGGARSALSALEEAAREAQALGLKVLAAECALRAGEASLATGDTVRGSEQLEAALRTGDGLLPADLLARGHHLLARALELAGEEANAALHADESARLVARLLEEPGNETLTARADLRPVFEAADSPAPVQ